MSDRIPVFDCDEAAVDWIDRKTAYKQALVPASFDGKYATVALIALTQDATDEQLATLEAAINAITGVHQANVFIKPSAIPLSTDTPVGYDLAISIEAKFKYILEA